MKGGKKDGTQVAMPKV